MRSAEKRAQLGGLDIDLFDGVAASPATLAKASGADVILISVPPSPSGDGALDHFGAAIGNGAARRVIYLSTIGVYGDHRGDWIHEETAPQPALDRTASRLAVEHRWRELLGDRLAVLRLAGIYGPGRSAFEKLREGTARRIVKPGQVFNRIHVEDIGRVTALAARNKLAGTSNLSDDEPAPPQDLVAYAAEKMGVPVPPDVPFEEAQMTEMARSFYSDNKRVRNIRMKHELGVTLAINLIVPASMHCGRRARVASNGQAAPPIGSRVKRGLVPRIHAFLSSGAQRRGWPGQARL